MQQSKPENDVSQAMQLLPTRPQSPLTVAIGRHRQCQQTKKAQRPDNNVRPLAQLDTQLRPVKTKNECAVATEVEQHIGKAPQSQLSPHGIPPRPTGESLQRRHAQGYKQQNKRPQTQSIDQHLARIRPEDILPGLVQPQQRPHQHHDKDTDTPKRIAHQ
ncbi:hypothetical protein D9M69_434620 [compost metagenome]